MGFIFYNIRLKNIFDIENLTLVQIKRIQIALYTLSLSVNKLEIFQLSVLRVQD